MKAEDMIDIEFDTMPYKRAHGKMPRGRGGWAFGWNGETMFAPGNLTLAEAKKWVKAVLVRRGEFGMHIVEVLS